jgi:hyperosmotically inducible periplasmic protein
MIKITKFSHTFLYLLSVVVLVTLSACNTTSKTASDAPSSTANNGQVSTKKNEKATQTDAESEVRRKQLDADIRAREQRNNVGGDPKKRADEDLSSEVRSKLEANIPNGKLTISAKNAEVTVSGVVATQEQLDKVEALGMAIKGVKKVIVKATVSP